MKLYSAVLLSLVLGATIDVEITSAQTFLFSFGTRGSEDGQFDDPEGVAVDSAGSIYVSDFTNHRIQKFDSEGNFLVTWGWGVRDGSEEFQICTENCRAGLDGSGDGQFHHPIGLAVDSTDSIYVADEANHRIQKFDSQGTFILKFGTVGTGNGQFRAPLGVAVDGSGNVYVADTRNSRVQKFSSNGQFIFSFGTFGSGDGQFDYPATITVDGLSDIYVVDTFNNRIQKFDPQGTFLVMWGWGVRDGSEEFQICTGNCRAGLEGSGDGQFRLAQRGIAVDSSGNILVSDTFNSRIQEFDSEGNFLMTWGWGVQDGSEEFQICAENCRAGLEGSGAGQFDFPVGIAVDELGDIYVVDIFNWRIQVFGVDEESDPNIGFEGGSGGCSIAADGTTPSIPLYLLVPVLALVRRMWVSLRN